MSEIDKDINVPNKNDTISKQAAEDIVRFECGEWTGLAETIVKRFEALPSAQPEPIRLRLDHELSKEECERLKKDCAEQPIILLPKESAQPGEDIRAMCGECDAWNQYKNYPQPGWIPTSVKPPEPFKLVLIQDYCGCYELNTYIPPRINPKQYPNGYWGEVGTVDFDYFDVEAWCPLPAPYCPEGEEHERFD